MVPSPSDTLCTFTEAGTSWPIALSTAAAVDVRTASGSPRPPSVMESTRTATRPPVAYGVPIMTNSVVPKNTRAVAVRRTLLVVVRTTGSRTVTPLTVCGNDDAAAFVSSASVTVSVKVDCGGFVAEAVADGTGVTERVGDGLGEALLRATVGLGEGKTTRDGMHPRTNTNAATITMTRSASRASDATPYASRRRSRPNQSQ